METAKSNAGSAPKPRKPRTIRARAKDREGSAVDSKTFASKKIVQFETAEDNLHFSGIKDIDPKDLAKHLADVVLIDVRQPEEFTGELGHIPGAQLLPLGQIEEQVQQLPKNKTVVFICRSGGRSARAAAVAHEQGFQEIFNLKGGMILWNELHLPTEV